MYGNDYTFWEEVGVNFVRNVAAETIDLQHVHGALMRDQDGSCPGYVDSTLVWQDADDIGTATSLSISSGSQTWSGTNDAWQLASGHDWWDDGSHWEVKGGADTCDEY
jgi:hypothetical protein